MTFAVVGGGMMGLSIAYSLAKGGHSIAIYEAEDTLGGLASPWEVGGLVWDRHYHVILEDDSHLIELLDEIGLREDLKFRTTRTGVFAGGRLFSVSNIWEWLRFPHLSLLEKMRIGATIIYASRLKDPGLVEDLDVESWLRRLSGDRAFERFWRPLLLAKLGESYRDASAAFMWATIGRLYGARKTKAKVERFGFVEGGYKRIISRLEEVLARLGVQVHLGCRVETVEKAKDGVVLRGHGLGEKHHHCAIITVPYHVAAKMLPGLSPGERKALMATRYIGVVCASMLLSRPLAGFYVINVLDEGLPFTGVIEMSALTGSASFGGRHLLYLPKYAEVGDPIFEAQEDTLRAEFIRGLRRICQDLKDSEVLAFRISKVPYVMALPTPQYLRNIPSFRTSVPRVYIVNSAQIRAGTLNVNETLAVAKGAVGRVLEDCL